MPLKLDIVTPEKEVFSDEVDSVGIPGLEGDMELLSLHAPLVTMVHPGELYYRKVKGGELHRMAIGEGFVEVSRDTISVMADLAVNESDIDENAAEEAIKRAESALADTSEDDENFAALQAVIAKSMAQIDIKRRYKNL